MSSEDPKPGRTKRPAASLAQPQRQGRSAGNARADYCRTTRDVEVSVRELAHHARNGDDRTRDAAGDEIADDGCDKPDAGDESQHDHAHGQGKKREERAAKGS